jgi:mono/diheme cytochrome c family protein
VSGAGKTECWEYAGVPKAPGRLTLSKRRCRLRGRVTVPSECWRCSKPTPLIAAALAICAAAISACGQSSPASTTHASGKQLFIQNCGRCHTLAAAGTGGRIGPNLDDLFTNSPPAVIEPVVRHQIATGGGKMPAGILRGAAAKKVAAYVATTAGQ